MRKESKTEQQVSKISPPPAGENPFLQCALLLLLAFIVYIPALNGTFLWDDAVMVRENNLVTGALTLKTVWFRTDFPLSLTILWAEWMLWGTKTFGYHIVNILLHGGGAILLWQILRTLRVRGALLAGAIFAVHPVAAATVAWISELKNTLSLVLFLFGALFYLKSDGSKSNVKYFLALLFFLLALLAKTSTVALPVVMLVCVWWKQNKITARDIIRVAPFFVLALAFGLMTVWFQSHQAMAGETVQKENFAGRLAGAGHAVWFYLRNSFFPANLSMIYPRWEIDPRSLVSWLPVFALAALAIWFWKNRGGWGRHALAALVVFVALLFPVLGFFDMYFMVYSRVADHFQYLALAATAAFAASVIAAKFPTTIFRPMSAVLILVLAVLTFQRAKVFQAEETLWSDTLEKNSGAWCAHNNLGNALLDRGQTQGAIAHYLDAAKINPASGDAHNNLGVTLVTEGKFADAIAHHREAVKIQPGQPRFHFNLGAALARAKQFDEAATEYQEAIRQKKNYAEPHNNLSNVLNKQGKNQDAVVEALKALEIKPNFPEAHFNLATAFSALGKSDEAVSHFADAVRLKPNFPEAQFAWGIELATVGKMADAEKHFREAAWLNPDDSVARSSLGSALAMQGKLDEAVAEFEAALKLDSADPQTHYNLGLAFLQQKKTDEAAKHFREVLRLDSGNAEARRQLESLGK